MTKARPKPRKFLQPAPSPTWEKLTKFFGHFLSTSSIHGLSHLADRKRHPVETFIWILLITAASYGAIYISILTLTRYSDNPTVISMERDRFSWNTSFPAATICPTYKVDEKIVDLYVSKSSATNKTLFKRFLVSLAEASYNNFDEVVDYGEEIVVGDQFMNLLLDLQFEFNPSFTDSAGNRQKYTLEKIISEMGICYTFNSQLAVYLSPDYWDDGRWDLVYSKDTFYVNPLDGEVYANLINLSTGFDIYLHGPYEVVDVASKSIHSENEYFLQLYLSGLTLFSSHKIRSLSVNQRKCRFFYESDLRHSPAYSFVLCRMECRASLAKKLCGCIPHFYRKLDGETVCGISGLHCLGKYKERLILLKGECNCLPNCDEVNYVIEALDTREWFLGSNLQWGLMEYPKMRLRRDVIFGFTELLVYIGGMAGLFLGCSVLSFIEIIYFFTLRLFWFVQNYKQETTRIVRRMKQ